MTLTEQRTAAYHNSFLDPLKARGVAALNVSELITAYEHREMSANWEGDPAFLAQVRAEMQGRDPVAFRDFEASRQVGITFNDLRKGALLTWGIMYAVAAGGAALMGEGLTSVEAATAAAGPVVEGSSATAAAAATTTTATTAAATTSATASTATTIGGSMSWITDQAASLTGDIQAVQSLIQTAQGPQTQPAPAPTVQSTIGNPDNNMLLYVGGAIALGLVVWLAARS